MQQEALKTETVAEYELARSLCPQKDQLQLSDTRHFAQKS